MNDGEFVTEWFGKITSFPELSVLHLEFEVPKRWTNKLYAAAGKPDDPFIGMEKALTDFLESDVRLIGFTIRD